MKCPFCKHEISDNPTGVSVKMLVDTPDEYDYISESGTAPQRWGDRYLPLNMYTCDSCQNIFFTQFDPAKKPIMRQLEQKDEE